MRILKLLLSIVYFLAERTRRWICRIFWKPVSPVLVTLTYHSIKEHQVEPFTKQMALVRKHTVPISILDSEGHGKPHCVIVTFDDGFESVLTRALPVLEEMGIPTTIFVPFDHLGNKPIWIKSQKHPNANEKLLSSTQLSELPGELVEIGSHTISHPRLSRLENGNLKREIIGSRDALEKIVQKPVRTMSLPYGDYNERVIDISRHGGYHHVFLNTPNVLFPRKSDYLQGRINVSLEDWPIEFYLKIMGAFQWLALAIPMKRRILWLFKRRNPEQVDDT